MDKNEYRAKLDEINSLVDQQDYKGALKIVETIDWRRVKSARTLCMVGEIYEANKRYEDSKKLLLLAHQRAPIGKTVLYRLVELSIKMGNFDDALDFYKLFVEVSPNDNSRYILKYKIHRAKRSPIEEQISILQEYKNREYTERWAYELARLYAKAGMQEACVEECDDLILWFSEGKYVTKAMELKMKYVPLSAAQQTKYDKRFRNAPSANVLAAAEAVTAAAGAAAKLVGNTANPPAETVFSPEQDKEIEDILNSIVMGDAANTAEAAKMQEEAAVTEEPIKEEPAKEEESSGFKPFRLGSSMTMGVKAEAPKSQMFRMDENSDVSAFKTDIKGREFDLEALLAETANELAQAVAEEAKEEAAQEPEKVKAEDIVIADIEEVLEAAAEKITEEPEKTEIIEETDGEISEETEAAEEITEVGAEENVEAAPELAAPAAAKAAVIAESLTAALAAKAEEFEARAFGAETIELPEIETEEEAPAAEPEIVEEAEEAETAEVTEEPEIIEEAVEAPAEEEVAEEVMEEEVVEEEVVEETEEEETAEESENSDILGGETKEFPVKEVKEKALEIDFSKILEQELEDTINGKTEEESNMKRVTGSVSEETSHGTMAFNTAVEGLMRHHLTQEEHRRLFTYFAPIPGMTQQITEALDIAQGSACAKTSQAGNIVVTGREGSGKTRLSEGLIKALCKERQMEGAKVAFINAKTLNKKDPVTVVGKMAGGFLVVEHAGSLKPDVVENMSKAMEFKTNRLTVILEDLKPGIRSLEEKYPDFMKKFDSRITIPAFTNDELVSFAKTYAKELGYKIDDMAVLALYTLIGDNQNEENPVAVGLVREMMDDAIKKASKKGRKAGKKVGKRHMDESGRIMLYEKDFDV